MGSKGDQSGLSKNNLVCVVSTTTDAKNKLVLLRLALWITATMS